MLKILVAAVLTVLVASLAGLVVILLIEGRLAIRRRRIANAEEAEDAEDAKGPRSSIPSGLLKV